MIKIKIKFHHIKRKRRKKIIENKIPRLIKKIYKTQTIILIQKPLHQKNINYKICKIHQDP
jgi:hypothetical protein